MMKNYDLSATSQFGRRCTLWLMSVALVVYVLVVGLMAAVPPVDRDGLTHHLAIPKLYFERGGLVELPDIPFSYYPMNLDLLFMLPLAWGNDILPKYIHWAFALATGLMIFLFVRQRSDTVFGLLGALLYLSLPVVMRLSTMVYVDLGLACFTFASLKAILRWGVENFRIRQILLAGMWSGLALGTKYNGLIALPLLGMMVVFIYARRAGLPRDRRANSNPDNRLGKSFFGPSEADRSVVTNLPSPLSRSSTGGGCVFISATGWALVFVLVSLVVFSPWMIRNVHWTGNPIYPMLQGVFTGPDRSEAEPWGSTSDLAHDTGGTVAVHRFVFKEPLWYVALLPLRVFFEGRDDDPRRFDGRLNPFLLLLAPLACFRPRGLRDPQRMEDVALLAFSILYILMAIFTSSVRVRYLMPAIPPLCALSALGSYRFAQAVRHKRGNDKGWVYSFGLATMVMVMLGLNFSYGADLYRRIGPIEYLSGKISREEYITRFRPEYPLIQLTNRTVAPTGRILALFLGNRRYYFDRDVSFSERILLQALKHSSTAEQVLHDLTGKGFTHLMLRTDLFEWWIANRITADDRSRVTSFLRDCTEEIHVELGFQLLALK
jgi:hypothetical protein